MSAKSLWLKLLADIDGDVNVAILDVAEVVDTDVDVNVVSDHNIGADDDLVTKFRTLFWDFVLKKEWRWMGGGPES